MGTGKRSESEIRAYLLGDPPGLPGREQKLDRSRGVLHHPGDRDGTIAASAVKKGHRDEEICPKMGFSP